MFKLAINKHWLEVNPVREVPMRREDNKRLRYLRHNANGPDELRRLFKACRESEWDRLYPLVTMAIGTGARLGELLGRLIASRIGGESKVGCATRTLTP